MSGNLIVSSSSSSDPPTTSAPPLAPAKRKVDDATEPDDPKVGAPNKCARGKQLDPVITPIANPVFLDEFLSTDQGDSSTPDLAQIHTVIQTLISAHNRMASGMATVEKAVLASTVSSHQSLHGMSLHDDYEFTQ